MFEKEEELTTIDHKEFQYPILFLKKLFQYRKKKVHLSCLELWTGNRCNLRCQHCISLIPYVTEQRVPAEKICQSLNRLLKMVTVDRLILGGGEPFLDPNIHSIIKKASVSSSIRQIQIDTNGTVIPSEQVIQALQHPKVHVRINRYPGIEVQADHLFSRLKESQITCSYRTPLWKMAGGPFQQRLHFEMSRVLYKACAMKRHAVLFDGEFTACPRGIHTRTVMGMSKNSWEHLNVFRLKPGMISRARIAVAADPNIYKDYCLYCLGMSPENPYQVIPGEQYRKSFERRSNS